MKNLSYDKISKKVKSYNYKTFVKDNGRLTLAIIISANKIEM